MLKYLSFCLLILLLNIPVFAQVVPLVTGNWQAVIMSNNEMYYDLEKDSFAIDKNYLRTAVMENDILNLALRKEKTMLNEIVKTSRLQLSANGSYKVWYSAQGAISGHYLVNEQLQIITFLQDGEEKIKDQMQYQLHNERLVIKLGDIEKTTSVDTLSSPALKNAENELTIVYKKVNQF